MNDTPVTDEAVERLAAMMDSYVMPTLAKQAEVASALRFLLAERTADKTQIGAVTAEAQRWKDCYQSAVREYEATCARAEAAEAQVASLSATIAAQASVIGETRRRALPSVDDLAQIIRCVDGKHSLGAGALAEAILAALARIREA